jgi:hypothetical protein
MLEESNGLFGQYQAELQENAASHLSHDLAQWEPRGSAKSAGNADIAGDPKPAKKPADPAKRYVAQMAQLWRLFRSRRDDPAFPSEKWGDAFGSANRLAGNKWPTALKFALCGGKGVFDDIKDVPQRILNEVQDGLNRSWKRQSPIKYTPEDLSRKFRVTCAERYRLKLWSIGAIDATPDECRAYAERQRDKKRANAERARANRAAANPNYRAREDSVAAEARRMGVEPKRLQERLRRWKKSARKAASANSQAVAQNAAFSYAKNDIVKPCTKRPQKDRAATAKAPVNQAIRSKSNFAESHVFSPAAQYP